MAELTADESAVWASQAGELSAILHLTAPPIGITWLSTVPQEIGRFDAPMPDPAGDGRTGRAAASCVFWMHATESTFTTVAEDHGNCSVGRMTHGWNTMAEVAGNEDVAALLGAEWVSEADIPEIPVVADRPEAIVYGPLASARVRPDVVLIRLNAKQLMILSDALPGLRIEGKPQCHILAVAKEQGEVVASVGCMLSRVRTGMQADEMTCAIPAASLSGVNEALRRTTTADGAVAQYAAADAARFART